MQREFLKPFALERGEDVLRIPAEFSGGGILRLQVISGAPVYGFRGAVTKETAALRTTAVVTQKHGEGEDTFELNKGVDFDIAANANCPGVIFLEKNIGELTLYSPDTGDEDPIGFLQFIAC